MSINNAVLVHFGTSNVVFFSWRNSPQWGRASLSKLHDHAYTHHIRYDSSERVISPSQRPLPDKTQDSQETDINDFGGIWTRNPRKRAIADPRLRPRGHRDRHLMPSLCNKFLSSNKCPTRSLAMDTATKPQRSHDCIEPNHIYIICVCCFHRYSFHYWDITYIIWALNDKIRISHSLHGM